MAEKAPAFPVTSVILGGLALALAVRGLHRPHRALVQDGYVSRCSGKDGGTCREFVEVQSARGVAPVYSTTAGTVVESSNSFFGMPMSVVMIASSYEPVVLVYGNLTQLMVKPGDNVVIGQQIGLAEQLAFAVLQVERKNDGTKVAHRLEPTSWLAARGMGVSHRRTQPAVQWCDQGRNQRIPAAVLDCGMKLPAPVSFLALPVSLQTV